MKPVHTFSERGSSCRQSNGLHVSCAAATDELRISRVFTDLKAKKQCAFVPFICAGDPDLDTTAAALQALDKAGADVIELGIPYSDPLADGPTIQAAATRALKNDVRVETVLDFVAEVAPTISAPLVLFTYINPILRMGFEPFVEKVAASGVAGLLVPDIPLEETVMLQELTKKAGVELVLLSTPTTPDARMKSIVDKTSGFLYLVSVTGVTGMKSTVESRVEALLGGIREYKPDIPVAVGFGVSNGEQAAQLEEWGADGVIVGSALVRALGEAATPEEGLASMTALAEELRAALPCRD